MNLQEIARPDLPGIARSLFADRSVVAITGGTGGQEFAAEVAWDVARAATATGRKIALIDLALEDPVLHNQAKAPKTAGIVDAFLFGASLQHVASRQENPDLHFIGAGTLPLDPSEIWAHDRWLRLARGFAKEDALLLLFLPPAAMSHLPLTIDLIVVATPSGFGARGPRSPDVQVMMDRGMPVTVITDSPPPMPEEQPTHDVSNQATPPEEFADAEHQSVGLLKKIGFPAAGVLVIAIVVASTLLMSGRDSIAGPVSSDSNLVDDPALVAGDSASTEAIGEPVEDSVVPGQTTLQPVSADTLDYSIQVAAWSTLDRAFDHMRQFRSSGIPTTVTVIPRDSSGVLYRVVVGAVSGLRSARELQGRLRADSTIDAAEGVLVETPLAFLLATYPDSATGLAANQGLRESGIPAYIVPVPDGSVQIFVGAFDSADQAELTDSVLLGPNRDISRTLVTRVGIAR